MVPFKNKKLLRLVAIFFVVVVSLVCFLGLLSLLGSIPLNVS